jgi:hypothetical protein
MIAVPGAGRLRATLIDWKNKEFGVSGDLAEIFSRKQRIGGIGAAPVRRRIIADAGECGALAAEFGLPGVARLAGDFTLQAARGQAGSFIDAELTLEAKVTRICVVTLEPFEVNVKETAQLRFVPAAALREDAELAELNPESLEGPDEIPYTGESVDLGAALAEQLALALDPYPRKPGAELPADFTDSVAHPFAALAARRGKPANDPE